MDSPLSPSNLVLTPGTASILLEWANNDIYPNALVIMRKPTGGSYQSVGQTWYADDDFVDDTAEQCVEYTYYVTTSGNDEFGNPYGPTDEETATLVIPAPTGLVATPVSDDDSIDLEWTNNDDAYSHVRVGWRKGDTGTWGETAIAFTASANVGNLDEGQLYAFRVRAYDPTGGYSQYSTSATATVEVIPPSDLEAVGNPSDNTQIDLTWADNSGHETRFDIQVDGEATGPYGDTAASGSTGYTAPGFVTGTYHYFAVRACVGATCSDWSATAGCEAGFPPEAPVLGTPAPSGSYAMDIAWTPTGTGYDGFYVYRSEDDIVYDFVTGTTAGATGHHDTGLTSDTTYWYMVSAYNDSGETDSNQATGTTDNDTEAPTGLALTVVSDTQIRLRFSNNSDDVDYHKVIYRKGSEAYGSTDQTSIVPPSTGTVQGNLTPNTLYYFKVRDLYGAEYSAYSGEVGATTQESGTPSSRRNETYFAFGSELNLTTDEMQGVREIDSVWTSKPTDFSESDPDALGRWKTVEKVTLEYEDIDADTPVMVAISVDQGENWIDAVGQGTASTASASYSDGYFLIGSGDGAPKSADFHFAPVSSKYFQFRIRSLSSSTISVWTALLAYYRLRGPYRETS